MKNPHGLGVQKITSQEKNPGIPTIWAMGPRHAETILAAKMCYVSCSTRHIHTRELEIFRHQSASYKGGPRMKSGGK